MHTQDHTARPAPARNGPGNSLTGAALGWIREDLDKQLRKVRMQAENLAANPLAGAEALAAMTQDVDQMRLTFEALVLDGAAQVMAGMHGLCQAMLDGEARDRDGAMSALMETMVVVPAYLDRLQAGHRDLPVLLLPLINRLRAARGADALSEGTLFTPLLDVELPELDIVRRPGYDEPRDYFMARMIRQYEQSLLNWEQDQQDLSLLSPLHGIAETMRHRLERYDLKRLWWVATEVVGGLMDGQAENELSLRRLLARLNLLLQVISEHGEGAITTDATTSITQGLLFHVAKTPRGNEGLDLVRERFELDRLIPDRDALMRAHGTLSGRDRDMYTSLSKAVQDELSLIKDALDLELRTGKVEPERRRQSMEALERLCDTLRMLGLSAQAQAVDELLPGFAASAEGSHHEREGRLMSLAERLLVVESALNEQIETLGEPLPEAQDPRAFELRRIHTHLLDESVASVYQAEDAFRRRLGGDNDAEPSVALDQLAGALTLMGEHAVAEQAHRLSAVLRGRLQRVFSEAGIRGSDLNRLTDSLAALELHLAARRDQQPDSERFLHILTDRLEQLEKAPASAEVKPFPAQTTQPGAGAAPAAAGATPPAAAPAPAPAGGHAEPVPATPAPAAATVPAGDALPAPIDPELREIFLEEYETVLESLQQAIPDWMGNAANVDALTRIRRAFHTLKGSGRMVGAEELGDFSWQVEGMLNALLEGRSGNAADMQVMVRLAQATLPALRQRLLQQPAAISVAVIHRIGAFAHSVGQGMAADWGALRNGLPAYLAGMLPGAISPRATGEENLTQSVLATDLATHLRTLQDLLEAVSRDRGVRVSREQVRAAHTMAGALAMEPEARDADIARALEQVLEAQGRTGHRFSSESVWTLVSAVGQLQSRLERLQGGGEKPDAGAQDELVDQLRQLAVAFATQEADVPSATAPARPAAFDPGQSVFARPTEPEPGVDTVDGFDFGGSWQLAGEDEAPGEDALAGDALAFEDALEGSLEEALEEALEAPEADGQDTGAMHAEAGADADITRIFLEEAGEVLTRADALLNQWRDDVQELRFVRHLQREIHTFKGGARMSGLLAVGDFAHSMETLLEQIAERGLSPTVSAIQVLETACDRLHRWVEQVAAGRQPVVGESLALLEQQLQSLREIMPEPLAAAPTMEAAPGREVQELVELPAEDAGKGDEASGRGQVRVAAELLDRMVNAAGEVSIFRSRLEQQVGGLRVNLGEFDETLGRLREQFRKLDIEIEAKVRSGYPSRGGEGAPGFDPLEMDEFSTLHQLSRSLSESVADLANLQEMLEDNTRKSEQLLLQQSRVATELQEGLMRTRMVPFGSIATRLRRIVRGAATESGRKARLKLAVVGTSDALDRNVLEHITAPLEHMMRNAVVHGIEPPKQRTAAGKPAEGQIAVTVESEATEFVIRIADDGAGINLDAIRERAIERGLLDADADPRPEQLYEFILDSGFSTSDSVTSLAGRGVGMDVVSSEIKQIGGSLEIESGRGRGTLFTIRIPFTLAVMQAIGVVAGRQRYLLPLSAVVGVSRMLPDEYAALVAQDEPRYRFAGQEYPVLDLEAVLGESARPLGRDNVSLLILSAGEQKAVFRVAELLPHREIVIKPVGPQVSCVPGILGGAISASGEVQVILDPGPMIRHARLHGVRPAAPVQPVAEDRHEALAMVVDDSITMRKVTSRVLEGHGLQVVTARDGVEALELMQERVPDILLLDIEMPRMDGYELAQHVRDDLRLRHVPIIMITSRAGQKHRDRAAQVGANAYLSKPYSELELLQEVRRLLEHGIEGHERDA